MSEYPAYIQHMIAGTATLKRVVVSEDEDSQADDIPTCCVMSLSEDLNLITFSTTDAAWELPVKEVSKVIQFEDEPTLQSEKEYLLGLLVPADRLVVALEFANEEDLNTWSYGMQVLTHKVEEYSKSEGEVTPPAAEESETDETEEFDDLHQENQLLREALAARDETVNELLQLVQTLIKRQLTAEPAKQDSPRTSAVQLLGA